MSTKRDTYKYYMKKGKKIVHVGITKDLERREAEHKLERGSDTHLYKVGNRTTRPAALEWEDKQRKRGKPTGP